MTRMGAKLQNLLIQTPTAAFLPSGYSGGRGLKVLVWS
jgi:hypothetical protein